MSFTIFPILGKSLMATEDDRQRKEVLAFTPARTAAGRTSASAQGFGKFSQPSRFRSRAYISNLELGQRNPTIITLWHAAQAPWVEVHLLLKDRI